MRGKNALIRNDIRITQARVSSLESLLSRGAARVSELQQGAHGLSEESTSVANFLTKVGHAADAAAAVRALVDASRTAPKSDFEACADELQALNIQARGDDALKQGAHTHKFHNRHPSLLTLQCWYPFICACSKSGFRL